MIRIHQELSQGNKVNCSVLARMLEVSPKTIQRDIEFMRDQQGMPIEYDPQEYSYSYTAEVEALPNIYVTEGELLALLIAQKALQQYEGTPFQAPLTAAFNKLTLALKDKISFSPRAEAAAVSFHNLGIGKLEMGVYEALGKAVMRRAEVQITYRKPGDANTQTRRLQPYHMANRENLWYVIGFDLDKGAIRTFALPRISKVELTNRGFVAPKDFSPDAFFGKSFGAFVGHGDYKVRIRFDAIAAERIRERFWQETQEIKELKDGAIEFSVQLNDLGEIERWILSWGPHAEALAPKQLRERVATIISDRARVYA